MNTGQPTSSESEHACVTNPSGDDEATRWSEGLSEAFGLLSVVLFAISTSSILFFAYLTYFAAEIENQLQLIAALVLGGSVVLVSTAGTLIGFRSYPRAMIVLSLIQIPVCCLVIVASLFLLVMSA
ncbi:hypothetical protein Poly59_31040 [Rubripirellula reticaptiva]|uniref:Uncharacterized protein n=1 Tax=Rubripirellula reticaptiva TaxID=2528013 RepID=A0A5C6ER41_9BACT|nr:hypothetical protein Poly59_31040 [Rubripirellula reticaptiva]